MLTHRLRAGLGRRVRSLRSSRTSLTVVVLVRRRCAHLDACLDSVLGSAHPRLEVLLVAAPDAPDAERAIDGTRHLGDRRVRRVPAAPGSTALHAALLAADGPYLAFVDADDVVPGGAFERLASVLDSTGSDLVLGAHVDVRGRRRQRVPWAATVLDGARRTTVAARPDLVVDLDLTGKLFRLDRWRAAGAVSGEGEASSVEVARVLLAASAVDTVPDVVYERHDRQASWPVPEQDRFRPGVLARHLAGLERVDALMADQPAAVEEAWQAGLLTHLLPRSYADAVAGGPPTFDVLAASAARLTRRVAPAVLARVPLEARLAAWAAGRGALDDLALVEDHLADHPHGLPVDGSEGRAVVPAGLTSLPADAWRTVQDVDRRLRSTVACTPGRQGSLELEGAAFLEYASGERVTAVSMAAADGSGGRPVTVRPRHDDGLNLWAGRAHEDHSGSGFAATVPTADLPGGSAGPWQVTVTVGDRSRVHLLERPGTPGAAHAEVLVADAVLDEDVLTLEGEAEVGFRVQVTSARGATRAVTVDGPAGPFTATIPLRTDLFGEPVLLPAGTYRLDVRGADGRPLVAALPVRDLPERLGSRLRASLRAVDPGRLDLVVAEPLTAPLRSAFGQQRLQDGFVGSRSGVRAGTVLLETFRGRGVGDSPGAVGRLLLDRSRSEGLGLDVGFVVDDPSVVVPDGGRAVVRRTADWYDALATSAAYVSNAGAPYWFAKPAGQTHVQTWHGTPLKRIGEDRGPGDFATWRHRRRIGWQAAGWDTMVSQSPFCSAAYRSAFGFEGPVLEAGYPRNDVLVAPGADQRRAAVRSRLGLEDGDRVVLYAPTWREYVGIREAKPLYLDAERLTAALPDAVVLVRGHYNSTGQDDVFVGHPRIHDVTRYPDVADLFLAADVLVTDYSSVMFDFALTDRRIVLMTPDLEQYRDAERGFYFDIEEKAPGPLVRTTDEVVEAIVAPDAHAGARAAFRREFCPWDDGQASRRVVDYLLARLGRLP